MLSEFAKRFERLIISSSYNHVQQHISNAYFLNTSCGSSEYQRHTFSLLLRMVLSPSPYVSVLFIELQEQHSYLNYPYIVILRVIYVALLWSKK